MNIKFEDLQENFVKIGKICDIIDAIELELSALSYTPGMDENKHVKVIEEYLEQTDSIKRDLYKKSCEWFFAKYWEDNKIVTEDK